jgi:hypothetical protein
MGMGSARLQGESTNRPTRGGIKGVVELEILNRLQKQLGSVPIRDLFDLIVGTRYVKKNPKRNVSIQSPCC